MSINIPRGTQDILPGTVEKWQYIEKFAKDLCKRNNYHEIRTPMFEHTELFQRGVGDTTDIVQKEMYTFTDRGDQIGRAHELQSQWSISYAVFFTVRTFVKNLLTVLDNYCIRT